MPSPTCRPPPLLVSHQQHFSSSTIPKGIPTTYRQRKTQRPQTSHQKINPNESLRFSVQAPLVPRGRARPYRTCDGLSMFVYPRYVRAGYPFQVRPPHNPPTTGFPLLSLAGPPHACAPIANPHQPHNQRERTPLLVSHQPRLAWKKLYEEGPKAWEYANCNAPLPSSF